MKKFLYSVSAAAIVLLASCNANYKTTPSGMKYKIMTGKVVGADTVGVPAKPGSIVKFKFKFSIPEKNDTVFRPMYDGMPQYTMVDTSERSKMTFLEIFPQLKSGDSAEVIISIDSILAKAPGQQLPPFMTKGSHVKATVSILNVFTDEKVAREDMNKEQEKQKAIADVKLKKSGEDLDKYIKDKGIKAIKTKNGIYIALEVPGDISQKADSGKIATIKYTGTLIDGKAFDSNIDSTVSGHTDPISVPVGEHRVIEGWDEALPYFGKGGKGTIYIPAGLAYGEREQEKIPAYSNLVFNIQVLDVKSGEAGQPGQPGQAVQPRH